MKIVRKQVALNYEDVLQDLKQSGLMLLG